MIVDAQYIRTQYASREIATCADDALSRRKMAETATPRRMRSLKRTGSGTKFSACFLLHYSLFYFAQEQPVNFWHFIAAEVT